MPSEFSLSTLCTNRNQPVALFGCTLTYACAEGDVACCSRSPQSHDNAQWLGGNGRRLFCSIGTKVMFDVDV